MVSKGLRGYRGVSVSSSYPVLSSLLCAVSCSSVVGERRRSLTTTTTSILIRKGKQPQNSKTPSRGGTTTTTTTNTTTSAQQSSSAAAEKIPLLREATHAPSRSGGKESDASSSRSKVRSKKPVPLFDCLVRTFYAELIVCTAVRLVGDCLQFLNPVLLKPDPIFDSSFLITYVERREEFRTWQGYLVVFGFFLVCLVVSVCHNHSHYMASSMGMKLKTALVATVYKKICLVFYFLSGKLGPSFMVGVGILLILIPLNIGVSVAARHFQAKQLILKDQRVKTMNELLTGIKVRAYLLDSDVFVVVNACRP
ncbi:hypothetical protein ACOMHN_053334 [Nucella lapillus]